MACTDEGSQSPAAFYVYNCIKIITVAPVTDKDGHVMCGTTSVVSREGVTTIATISNKNKNAMAYFRGPDIDGQTTVGIATVTDTATEVYTSGKKTLYSSATVTFQDISYGTFLHKLRRQNRDPEINTNRRDHLPHHAVHLPAHPRRKG